MDHVATLSTSDSVADQRLTAEREVASALSRNATQLWSHYRSEELSERALEKIHQLASDAGQERTNGDSDQQEEGGHSEPESVEGEPPPVLHELDNNDQQEDTGGPLEHLAADDHRASLSENLPSQQPSLEETQAYQPQSLEMLAQRRLSESEKEASEDHEEKERDAELETTEKAPVDVDEQEAESSKEDLEEVKPALHQEQTFAFPTEDEGREQKEGKRVLTIDLVSVSELATMDHNEEDIPSSSDDDFETPPTSPASFSASPFPQLVEDGAVDSGDRKLNYLAQPRAGDEEALSVSHKQEDIGSIPPYHQSQLGTDDTDSSSAAGYPQPGMPASHQGTDCGVNTDSVEVSDQASNTPIVEIRQQSANTDQVETSDNYTSIEIETEDKIVSTDRTETSEEATLVKPVMQEKGGNTELSAFELLKRVHSMEKLERLKSESKLMAMELNEEKSKRMVGDSLVQMLQSEIVELRQNNAVETTSRLRLETEVTSIKTELAASQEEVKEREKRIAELEESLQGTMHLVNKMEQQTAVMNKGGIDYLLLAKVAEGQAQEAKQQMTVLQTELLHSQSEVQRLLDRVGELSQDRREMVSNKVHTQLLRLSDERAEAAEMRVKELESQVMLLKSSGAAKTSSSTTSSTYPSLYPSSSISSAPSPYSTFDPFRASTSSSYLSGIGTSPFSYTGSSLTSSSVKPGGPYGYSGLSGSSLGSYGSGTASLDLFKPPSIGNLGSTKLGNGSPGSYNPTSGLGSMSSNLYPLSTTTTLGAVGTESTTQPSKEPYAHGTVGTSSLLSSFSNPAHLGVSTESSSLLSTLPDLASMKQQQQPPVPDVSSNKKPPAVNTESSGLPSLFPGSHGESDSSDWSSSGEEDDGGSKDGMSQELRPSVHMKLRSKWEWLSQQHSDSPQGQASGSSPQLAPAAGKKPRPPVAPKPKLVKRVSWDQTVLNEPPLSFEQPPTQPPLKVSPRPSGPRGRKLPSRFYDNQAPPQQDLLVNLPLFD